MASELLQKVGDDEAVVTAFDKFSIDITSKLESICQSCSRYQSISKTKTNMWCAFHQARVEELPNMWKGLFASLHMDVTDQFLEQSVNQRLVEMIIPRHIISDQTESATGEAKDEEIVMTKDELNALQYVGGFVPHSLLSRFEKNERYTKSLECLGDMAVASESDGDVLDYTKEWMEKVNRGGLFPPNNVTFQMFVGIEQATRLRVRCHHYIDRHDKDLEDIIESTAMNADVQWHWMLISQSVESAEESDWLLGEIIKLYVTVRGFSIAANWMELYKKESKKSTKKTTGLGKQLS